MNTLIITRYNNDGGVVTHVIDLANELTKMNHHVVIIAPLDQSGRKGRYEKLCCAYVPLDFEEGNIFKIHKTIGCVVKEHSIEIIHSHNRNVSLYAKAQSVFHRIPFVWTLHLNNIPSGIVHKLFTFAGDRTIAVSSELRDYCVNEFDVVFSKCSVVLNGIKKENYNLYELLQKNELKRLWNISDNQKVIVLLSRLEERKGHKVLLQAVSLLKKDYNIRVLITGTDLDDGTYKNRLCEISSHLGIKEQVSFVGYVNPVDILNVSDLLVLPSENEGLCIATLESFMMKVPVIRTKTGGYEDTKDCCIGIEVGNVEQLKNGIDKIFLDENYRNKLVDRAYTFVNENCTCEVMANNVLEVYNKTILEKRK